MKQIKFLLALLCTIPALYGMDSAPETTPLETLKELIQACDVDEFKQTYAQASLDESEEDELIAFAHKQHRIAKESLANLIDRAGIHNIALLAGSGFCMLVASMFACATIAGFTDPQGIIWSSFELGLTKDLKERVPVSVAAKITGFCTLVTVGITYLATNSYRMIKDLITLRQQIASLTVILNYLVPENS